MAFEYANPEPAKQAAMSRLSDLISARAGQEAQIRADAKEQYEQYMEEQKRREEEARKRAEGGWFSNIFGGGIKGALTGGLISGNPLGALVGGLAGAGLGGVGKATGSTGMVNDLGQLGLGIGSLAAMSRLNSTGSLWGDTSSAVTPGTALVGPSALANPAPMQSYTYGGLAPPYRPGWG